MILGVLFDHMRAPTRHTSASKHRNELRRLKPQRLQNQRSIEFHICAQIAAWFRFRQNAQRRLFNGNCQIVELAIFQSRLPQPGDRARDIRGGQIP